MEANGAFVVEADMENAIRVEQSQPQLHAAETIITASAGGFTSDHTQRYRDDVDSAAENTPLLPKSNSTDGSGNPGKDDFTDFSKLPWWKRPSVYWIFPAYTFMAVAFGGVMVPRINLVLEIVCRDYFTEVALQNPSLTFAPVIFGGQNPQCKSEQVQSRVARLTLMLSLITGLLSAFVAPKLGALSDRYGRQKIIALNSLGSVIGEIIFVYAARTPETFPIQGMYLAALVDGLFGSFTTAMALIHAYATDCTHPSKRSAVFGYFHGALFIGIAGGPVIFGYLIKKYNTILIAFYTAFVFHLLFLFVMCFIAPESLAKERQLLAREKHALETQKYGAASDWMESIRSINIIRPLKILWPTGKGTSPALRRNLVLISAIDTIGFGVAMGTMSVVVLYTGYMFDWGNFETGKFISTVNIVRVFALLVILPTLTRIYRGPAKRNITTRQAGADSLDLGVIRTAIVIDTFGYLGYSLARTGPMFTLAGVLTAFGGIGSPTLQAALTKHVGPDRVGQILGAQGLLHGLARVAGPLIFNGIYSLTVGKFTQTVYVCLTATFGLACICSWFLRSGVYLEESIDDQIDGQPEVPYTDNDDEIRDESEPL